MTVPNAVGLIEKLADKLGDKALIGGGTVLTPEIAGDCISAGAQFINIPHLILKRLIFVESRKLL